MTPDGRDSLLWVTSDKTHIEHNETALDLIADMPGDMDFCCNGPQPEISAFAGVSAQKATSPEASTIR